MLGMQRLLLLEDIARLGSMSAAATERYMSTSAVSQQIQKLESEVGQALVERVPHGVQVTELGLVLAEHGHAIRLRLAAAEADVASFANLEKGVVTFGSFPSASATLLPPVLSSFKDLYPTARIAVVSALRPDLINRLLSHELDLSVLWEYPWNRLESSELVAEPLLHDPTVYLVSEKHKLADHRYVRLSDLGDQEWIVRGGGHPAGEVLEHSTLKAGFSPRISFESHDYQETQAMVAAGLGIAMMPRLGLPARRSDVRIVQGDPHDKLPMRTMLLCYPSGTRMSPAAKKLYNGVFRSLAPLLGWLERPNADIRGPLPEW